MSSTPTVSIEGREGSGAGGRGWRGGCARGIGLRGGSPDARCPGGNELCNLVPHAPLMGPALSQWDAADWREIESRDSAAESRPTGAIDSLSCRRAALTRETLSSCSCHTHRGSIDSSLKSGLMPIATGYEARGDWHQPATPHVCFEFKNSFLPEPRAQLEVAPSHAR